MKSKLKIFTICIALIQIQLFAQNSVQKPKINSNIKNVKKAKIKPIVTTSSNLVAPTPKRDSINFGKLKIKTFDQKSQAFYPYGDEVLFTHIAHELKYTQADIDKKVDGKVLIRFDVDVDSTVKEVRVIRDPCIDCGKTLVSIFEKLKFAPAVNSKGTAMRSNLMMEIPVWAH